MRQTIPATSTWRKVTLAIAPRPVFSAKMTRRLAALALAATAFGSLGLQFWLNGAAPGLEPWGTRAWDLLRYFTILTVGLIGVLMLAEAHGHPVSANWQATALVNILMVGLIFQILLAPPEPPKGLAWWADFGFHAAIPILMLVWWVLWGTRPLRLRDLPRWLLWPIAYCAYALIRGGIEGRYPYFFVDVGQFGAAQVALNIVGLVLVFATAGLIIWVVARFLPRSAI
jgi:hypothetical protein